MSERLEGKKVSELMEQMESAIITAQEKLREIARLAEAAREDDEDYVYLVSHPAKNIAQEMESFIARIEANRNSLNAEYVQYVPSDS